MSDHDTDAPGGFDAAAETELTRRQWDSVADDWHTQVGHDGDANRRLNSDPVLWRFAGDVAGRRVLDAGCGTGYLSRQLAARGADVVGVDFSPEMIRIAREHGPGVDHRADDASRLATCADGEFDLVVSNYVLMDLTDLEGAVRAFHRVLRPGGEAITIFSHPCFPGSRAKEAPDGVVTYDWPHSYFERTRMVDPPWRHFTHDFTWFHRPLSAYFAAFREAGFAVIDFDEPHLTPDRAHLADDERRRRRGSKIPYSVAFHLRKP